MERIGNIGRWGLTAAALALVVGGSALVSAPAGAQAPITIPVARFYGNMTVNGARTIDNLTVSAAVGGTICSGTQANVSGSGSFNDSSYFIDIQAVPGCTTPGSTVVFTASSGAQGTYRAQQTGTIPDIPGTPVHLDLNFQLPATPTATAAPPPPPAPRPATTPAPPPPAPRPAATPALTPAPRPVTQQAPRGVAQGPAGKEVKQAPAYGARPSYAPPVAGARLPNTGTGGLLDEQTAATGWALAIIVLAALGASATGLLAYRRQREERG
jgi:hypothetical protein